MAVLEPGTRLVALLGDPVAHSRSPRMQAAAFDALGLPWAYVALRVGADAIGDAVRGLRALGFKGANVTVPHKERVLPFVDHVDERARRCRAVNTLVISDGEISGFNTDVDGVTRALAHEGVRIDGTRAVVLGAGGGARGACVALAEAGAREIVILARRRQQADVIAVELADAAWGARIATDDLDADGIARRVPGAQIIIHATPIGMRPRDDESPLPPSVRLTPGQAVLDMVYNPAETLLLRAAREAGAHPVSGLLMLAYQGASAFERWTGRAAPVDVMLRALSAP